MEFIKKSSANDLTLTIKGIINSTNRELLLRDCAPMIERGALILDETYTPRDQVIAALSKFDVGLCFYDFRYLDQTDCNMVSGPSGKMFNYFAAGVPVIANEILGFEPVREAGASVLIPNSIVESEQGPAAIYTAAQTIYNDYSKYLNGCYQAAKRYDFKRTITPYIETIID